MHYCDSLCNLEHSFIFFSKTIYIYICCYTQRFLTIAFPLEKLSAKIFYLEDTISTNILLQVIRQSDETGCHWSRQKTPLPYLFHK